MVRLLPALYPIAMLLAPVVLFESAITDSCIVNGNIVVRARERQWPCLPLAIRFLLRACHPMAVLFPPLVFVSSARWPLAVFRMPLTLFKSAELPVAVLASPVFRNSARKPIAVFWVTSQRGPEILARCSDRHNKPPGDGFTASALGKSAKQANTSGMRRKAESQRRPANRFY